MLTAEVKINGGLIAVLYIHNEGPIADLGSAGVDEYDLDQTLYTLEYHRIPGKTVRAKIVHGRANGAEVLLKKAFSQVVDLFEIDGGGE